ncbi:PqqD family peptide modification chaperone [Piscinibacter sakaiensis]|uniref:PqqD family peptide modification chaperone n=1 Tax=Piscinibacter sakaiensis TaxID=1547922 RepID=UPI003AAD31C0
MTASLYSVQWYRVAGLRPRLRAQVRVQRQQWRDQCWYLLSDAATGRQHRINQSAYKFVGRCDGQHTAHEVWNALLEDDADAAPTQDEVLALLGQLHEQELLQSEQAPNTEAMFERRDERKKRRRREMLNPFAFRLPLGDPSALLDRLEPLGRLLFTPAAFVIWLLGMLVFALLAAMEWPTLRMQASMQSFSSAHLAIVWLVYPLMKAVHELAHAMAVRRWGGEVHEVGIGLLFLIPAPYVDASAASGFKRRSQRAMVGAAGVLVELTFAALGLWLWLLTEPGLVHDIAFTVMLIGSASTLLFNGNPLLRFDAYHVMCDLFDVPNLGSRSGAWWNHHLGRWLLGSRSQRPAHADSERKWLWAYAPLSLAYRLLLSAALVLWLGGQWLLLGFFALIYVCLTVVLQPLLRWARQAMAAAQPGADLARLRLRLALVAGGAAVALFVVPLPFSTVAPAVVWLPEKAQVRPDVDGFIAELPVADGAEVKVGDLLVRLENPELLANRAQIASRLEGLRVEQFLQMLRDPNAAHNQALEIERLQAEIDRADQRIALLDVRAATAGRLAMPRQQDLLGSYMRQGKTLGHVLADEDMRIRAAVAGADAHLVRHRLRDAEVRLADAPRQVLQATPSGDMPAATRQLPSAALSAQGGGPYSTDPTEKDGLHSTEPVFLVDLTLQGTPASRIGGRAWVRFDHGSEPLAMQAWRQASQLFLRHFAPQA